MADEQIEAPRESPQSEDGVGEAMEKEKRKDKRKKRLLREAENADKRGVCFLSRVPPHMDPLKLRQILSQYGEIQRLYLTPEDPAAQVRRKKSGGFRGAEFSEGWLEFTNKRVAKRVARMLNGEQIGGKKRSSFYYDLWNIKYLSKFKWDDLTEEIAIKNATREQKLALELSAAKRERDFYLSKVDQSKAISKIEERLKKDMFVRFNIDAFIVQSRSGRLKWYQELFDNFLRINRLRKKLERARVNCLGMSWQEFLVALHDEFRIWPCREILLVRFNLGS